MPANFHTPSGQLSPAGDGAQTGGPGIGSNLQSVVLKTNSVSISPPCYVLRMRPFNNHTRAPVAMRNDGAGTRDRTGGHQVFGLALSQLVYRDHRRDSACRCTWNHNNASTGRMELCQLLQITAKVQLAAWSSGMVLAPGGGRSRAQPLGQPSIRIGAAARCWVCCRD